MGKPNASILRDSRYRQRLVDRLIELEDWAVRRHGHAPEDHLDLVLSHYLFGITSSAGGGMKPRTRLKFCLKILEEIMGPYRAHAAIHGVPDDLEASMQELCKRMEERGASEAELLRD